MIEFKKGDLFNSRCDTLVNTVNCVGVMGKGIALQFKEKYPHMFTEYKRVCSGNNYKGIGKLKEGGDLWVFSLSNYFPMFSLYPEPIKILCFATKEHWRNNSKIEWIERGLKTFSEYHKFENDNDYHGYSGYFYEYLGIKSIAWPKLGCNNGGLDWKTQVKPLMIKYLDPLPIKCEIYE